MQFAFPRHCHCGQISAAGGRGDQENSPPRYPEYSTCTELDISRFRGFNADGFRTAGGFAEGLNVLPDVQNMLFKKLDLGFNWVSCKYPASVHMENPGEAATPAVLMHQSRPRIPSQHFVYPSCLKSMVPMSPISEY